jgi:pantothenate kinase-related protein Tda10
MVQAIFNISSTDFDQSLFDKIKSFIEGNDSEIQVRIKRKESREEMRRRIEQVMEETMRGENLISFTGEEYEALVKNLSNK